MKMRRLVLLRQDGSEKVFRKYFEKCDTASPMGLEEGDCLLFSGGTDVSAYLYDEPQGSKTGYPDSQRDGYELLMFKRAQILGIPSVGICRGSQFLTVMNNGRLIQHVDGHLGNHEITLWDGRKIEVTSTHHQMMNPYGYFDLLGWSESRSKQYLDGWDYDDPEFRPDVDPEIVFYPKTCSLAIQGHPEYMNPEAPFWEVCEELFEKFIVERN